MWLCGLAIYKWTQWDLPKTFSRKWLKLQASSHPKGYKVKSHRMRLYRIIGSQILGAAAKSPHARREKHLTAAREKRVNLHTCWTPRPPGMLTRSSKLQLPSSDQDMRYAIQCVIVAKIYVYIYIQIRICIYYVFMFNHYITYYNILHI